MAEEPPELPDLEDIVIDHASSQRGTTRCGVACNKAIESDPGFGSVWLKTFGCAHNVSDGEYMAGLLVSYGYR